MNHVDFTYGDSVCMLISGDANQILGTYGIMVKGDVLNARYLHNLGAFLIKRNGFFEDSERESVERISEFLCM